MREILFRGKTLQGGEWVYGDYMRYAGGAQIWIHDPDGGTHNVLVDPATVGQWTGLTDKNGVRIFEGDVCAVDALDAEDGYFKVAWYNDAAVFQLVGDRFCLDFDIVWHDEVIGNIHDNPELLKGENENG